MFSPLIVGYGAVDKVDTDYRILNFIMNNYDIFRMFCGFLCDRLSTEANNTQLLVTFLFNLNVESRGKVYLQSSDPEDSTNILANYYLNDNDLDAVAAAIQDYTKVVSTPYIIAMGLKLMDPTNKCSHLKKGSREYWRCYAICMIGAEGRFVGSNSMGLVVDTKLRVYGVNKLRVVDSSVIPNALSGATFGPIVAVAEKAVELIISAA